VPATASLPSAPNAFRRDAAAATFIQASLSWRSAAEAFRIPLAPAGSAPLSGCGLRVLLVDDNPVNQMFGEAMLERLGFRVALASDGAEAVQRWKAESFDLVLMDCHMPVMDGFAASCRIREIERQRGSGAYMPIVALTVCVDDADREECVRAGMDAVLHKPFNPDELVAFVGQWARRVTQRQTLGASLDPSSRCTSVESCSCV